MNPATIASGLSEAQKDALFGRYSWPSPWAEEEGEIELVELGLWNELYGLPAEHRLTALGLAVRQYLKDPSHDQ